ncbi:menaquinone-specific isochorismate synthase [Prosthecobacter fusiformis]|uniref:Menaquinone-specific isochorismate synthase n=1 Tax=Prosthecobacter fusiformis TaxID=48464 RepID=A0A4R7S454_9BACT|nr:chorismate-binding protein [Prosthecobacter fusiformis]TDU73192.1 menaquinone-specific isochorismate synthase [Prosthecobacter fusiformis]
MMDIALFRLPDGRAWIGQGPFESFSEAPEGGGVFYINDFDLSDPQPWKKPAQLMEIQADTLAQGAGWNGAQLPHIQWAKPATEWFKMAFRRIRREVLSKRLEKMVPVLTERGTITEGDPVRLLERVMTAPPNTWGYGWIQQGKGYLGATPELLFRAKGNRVETMALAGTAKPGDQTAFLTDVKEIEEHEIVVRYLTERLGTLGVVEREPRGLCQAAKLLHFQSNLSVTLDKPIEPGALVREVHPTPAVGCLPREEHWLARLREYREQLEVPGFFGAPFGFIEPGESLACHMVVAIRGLSWKGHEAQLPSGCGIVGGSAFDHEWRELRLKREAVVSMLGL